MKCLRARCRGQHAAAGWRVAVLLLLPAAVSAQSPACGDLWNAFGPYDYRSDRDRLAIVERFHFTPEVEALIRGKSGHIGGDLDYTLRAFPNHHRALIAMMRYGERLKTTKPPRAGYTIDCYFDRALRFRPDDHIVRMIFAGHLANTKREEIATRQLEAVVGAANDNALTHYNVGLVYFEMKLYDRALAQAHKALELGYMRSDLKEKLKSVGRWVEP